VERGIAAKRRKKHKEDEEKYSRKDVKGNLEWARIDPPPPSVRAIRQPPDETKANRSPEPRKLSGEHSPG